MDGVSDKPRITIMQTYPDTIWACGDGYYVGVGATPKDAYERWCGGVGRAWPGPLKPTVAALKAATKHRTGQDAAWIS